MSQFYTIPFEYLIEHSDMWCKHQMWWIGVWNCWLHITLQTIYLGLMKNYFGLQWCLNWPTTSCKKEKMDKNCQNCLSWEYFEQCCSCPGPSSPCQLLCMKCALWLHIKTNQITFKTNNINKNLDNISCFIKINVLETTNDLD